ncbi:CES5A.2 family protein [Megaselia abdita]
MSRLSWSIASAFLILFNNVLASESDLLVKLNHGGSLIGTSLKSSSGRQIRSFLGIPFAKPPVGELRFKSPVPFPPWQGERNATESGSKCFQTNFFVENAVEGSEDCLFLNVFTPPVYRIPKGGLPVMVYIHGGGWFCGYNDHHFYSPEFIMDKDVILVVTNYRVGVLGFLSSETLDCPGNFGLKDQVEALRWVKEHISSFGGDPKSVTIFGGSAGGASVTYLMQSKTTEGLIHKAIPQSGTMFSQWALPLHKGLARKTARNLASLVNCDNEEGDWRNIIECIKNVDGSVLTAKSVELSEWNGFPYFVVQPVVEPSHPESFLDEYSREVSMSSLDIPLLAGMTSGEGLMATTGLLSNEKLLNEVKDDISKKFPLMLGYDHWDEDKQKTITKELENFYFKNGHNYNIKDHKNFTDMFTDSMFLYGFDDYLKSRLSAKAAPTYVYIFDMKTEHSLSKLVGGGDNYLGVCHGEDMQFIFPLHKIVFGETSDLKGNSLIMKEVMLELLVNFASYGNPTPPGSRFITWEPATKHPWNYARIGSIDGDGFQILKNEQDYASDRFKFWRSLKPHNDANNNQYKNKIEL